MGLFSPAVHPNIVLVVMDTARADAFEPWGAAPGTTPAVAQLASSGQCLTNVRSTANWTVPGHASMFSGELPRTLGLCQLGSDSLDCRPQIATAGDKWLPEVLRRNGYETSAVSTNLWISELSGFDAGFDRFENVYSPRARNMGDSGVRARLGWAREIALARADDGATQADALIGRWLEAERHGPFFWFVNLTECHSPYLPPRPFNDLNLLRRIQAADEARSNLTLESIWKTSLGARRVPRHALQRMRHLYQCSVSAMDRWVERLLQRLDDHSLLGDTIVIVTSDHGENFGECGLIGHCFSLDDRLLRVPFVASRPGFADSQMASLAEFPRAVAEVTGLKDHPWRQPVAAPGIAVAQMEALATLEKSQEVIHLWALDERAIDLVTTSSTCAVEGKVKLTRRDDGLELLYLLDLDTDESSPITLNGHLPQGTQETIARLRHAIDAADDKITTAVPAVPNGDREERETARIALKMRELGYL